jgi:pimeloyl-ACP methyl ester carboxylesterase
MPLVQLNHITLFYAEKGKGETVLFLNGLSGDHAYWMGQLRAFGRHYRCLAVDNHDVGRSGAAAGPYTIRDMAGDMAELFDHLQLPPAHVVGLSMGGLIAQELALARPAAVRSLVLLGTLGRSDPWFRATLEAFGLIRRQVADTAGFFEAILPWWVSYRFLDQPERVAWLRWLLHQNPHGQSLDGFQRQIEAIMQHDALDRLHLIRCPVLVLVGEDDSVAPPRYARQIQEHIPHAQLAILPGVGHAPPIEDAEHFNGWLAKFLAGQTPAQRQPA